MGRQLVVLLNSPIITNQMVAESTSAGNNLVTMLALEDAILEPVFELRGQEDGSLFRTESAEEEFGLSPYYRVLASDEKLDGLAERLRGENEVKAAFIKPDAALAGSSALATERVAGVADFTSRQGYLKAAPEGVDALYAWTVPGGRGNGVRIIDIEGAWQFTHEDLVQNQNGLAGGVPVPDVILRNHGTAVIGIISGDRDGYGITGICPDANLRAISAFDSEENMDTARAIRQAAALLGPGDIILIELHRPGPRSIGNGQLGYIPIEWWPDDYEAIQYAVNKGIIVVEAAGNGGENLDNPIYNKPDAGFPATWKNPFNRSIRDSGAIVVGAGAPPEGTHGHYYGPDRSRLSYSNYGKMLDGQAWGEAVTSAGYGDLHNSGEEDNWYTDRFSGTSSAAPIVAGVIGCLQGILKERNKRPLNHIKVRELLRSTGSPQQDSITGTLEKRIGNRPDLRMLISKI